MEETENKTRYVASNNEESFSAPQADTIEGAISEAVEYYGLSEGDTVYVGEVADYDNGEPFYPSGDDIIEWMAERAGENAGEWSEDWFDNLPIGATQELDAILRAEIRAWIIKHKLQPKFFTVEKVKKQEVAPEGQ